MNGLDSPLALPAGAQVQLGRTVSASAGHRGRAVAFAASAGVDDLRRRRVPHSASAAQRPSAGVAVAEAQRRVRARRGAAGSARRTARVDVGGDRVGQASARASFAVPEVGASAPARARVAVTPDPRSLSYGRGVPLRARVTLVTLRRRCRR